MSRASYSWARVSFVVIGTGTLAGLATTWGATQWFGASPGMRFPLLSRAAVGDKPKATAHSPDAARVNAEARVNAAEVDTEAGVAAGPVEGFGGVAMAYARACAAGDCDEVLGMTLWMTERMKRVALESADPAVHEEARVRLHARIVDRSVEGNQLRPEGIEDQYVFTPGTVFEALGVDAGREDLAMPVKERTWIRVTFPDAKRAPLDESGRPMRTVTVGVNVSEEGYVLKAGVVGNLDINRDSISYWASDDGA